MTNHANLAKAVSVQTTAPALGHTVDLSKPVTTIARMTEVTHLNNDEILAFALAHSSCGACAVFVSPAIELDMFSDPLNKILAAYLDYSRAIEANIFKTEGVTYDQLLEAVNNATLPEELAVSGSTRYLVAFYQG